jgi:pyruvate ferredoxin oxidoreductase beta subunit
MLGWYEMKEIKSLKDIPSEDWLTGGHVACAGCGATLALRLALKALNGNAIVVNGSGCMTLLTVYPYTPLKVPWMHNAIENAGATVSGIWRALKRLGKEDITVVAYAGDGATYDIGLQSLSGACERGENFLYICYNNQSYGNTGVQRSGATPYGANTSTTPPGKKNPVGNLLRKKDLIEIMAAHHIPYAATACIGFQLDFMKKVQKAAKIKGPKVIDVLVPCQPGWGFSPEKTTELGKLAVETGFWPLYEFENEVTKYNYKPPKFKPVKPFLKQQKRFSHLSDKEIANIQKMINDYWSKIK